METWLTHYAEHCGSVPHNAAGPCHPQTITVVSQMWWPLNCRTVTTGFGACQFLSIHKFLASLNPSGLSSVAVSGPPSFGLDLCDFDVPKGVCSNCQESVQCATVNYVHDCVQATN